MSLLDAPIPDDLKQRPQWLVWRFEPNPDPKKTKPLKVPYYARTRTKRYGDQGDAADRAKLVTFDVAVAAVDPSKPNPFSGIGFAFLPGDGLIGIDIDKCIDLDTGEISETADRIIKDCASYTEYSPSRTGVHIIVAGQTETFKSNAIGLEVFCGRQYFTFTGQAYAGMPAAITPIADATLDYMRELVKNARRAPPAPATSRPGSPPGQLGWNEERAKVKSALAMIPNEDYHVWIKVGMALYATFGEDGFSMWNAWSSDAPNYSGSDSLQQKWSSFKRGVSTTVAAIYALAMERNWRPPKTQRAETPIARPAAKSPPPPEDGEPPAVDNMPPVSATGTGDDAGVALPPPPTNERPKLRLVDVPDLPGGEPPVDGAAGQGEGAPAPRGKGKGKKKEEKERPQSFWDSIERLLDNFVMLYGTDTAWDEINRMQIKIGALRLAYSNEAVKFWLGNPDRKMINYDRLVFDPTGNCDKETHVNLYEGFAVKAKKGECGKIAELLLHLCNGDEDLFLWIMRWIAYPLRNPGAKMTTSIVMHGDEGSGKNLFWEEVVCALYGKYGGVIGNAQIETPYNEWVSQKLFFVCDEVVTRNEMKQLKGKLKALITGKRMNVNPKHLPERSEANHMNFVFLSNELQPLALDHTDRRYLVVWTPPKQDAAYYQAVADEAFHGGIEAFYHLLMHELDMGDFNEHTKPMDTEAKQDLITLSLDAPERFYREWSTKSLPLPFITCGAMQLYAAFMRWCHLNGERFPPTHNLFARKLKRFAGDGIRSRLIEYSVGDGDTKQRTVYLVGEKPEDKTQAQWAEDASRLFDKFLKKYRNVYDQSEMPDEG